ncbi:MAG: bifunctional hydroxymethylpyrimidine kinase/phosphomethylpyrimidine kinase [Symbiopectobacterium sp.]|uniref:bifunctional hydroxymethylpyrimidine kinase/phosphomethylpyrimidine kinase n=1 Tax=Symbiopectobacterium sp. TaxID=2952789 RepID=UPI003F3201C8
MEHARAPVMGDTDCGYYVNAEVNSCYRDQILPLATGLTPNAFELSCLSGMTLDSAESAITASRSLLKGAMEWVVVTSAPGNLDKQRIQ